MSFQEQLGPAFIFLSSVVKISTILTKASCEDKM